jgi:hypothetical protein
MVTLTLTNTDIAVAKCTIKAEATFQADLDLADNILGDRIVRVFIKGDVSAD